MMSTRTALVYAVAALVLVIWWVAEPSWIPVVLLGLLAVGALAHQQIGVKGRRPVAGRSLAGETSADAMTRHDLDESSARHGFPRPPEHRGQ